MQKTFFTRIMTSQTNYLLLFMLIKSMQKNKDNFSSTKHQVILEPFVLKLIKIEGHFITYFQQTKSFFFLKKD
jgi:hypothetical protein